LTAAGAQAAPGAAAAAVVRAAPAKLNLYLHVTGKRPDGYHLLDSLVAFAAVHDTLVAREADDLTLALDGPFAADLGDTADNLVLRAAALLRERAGVAAGAAITLVKRLPVASGIGGGSADAAAALRALDALWRTGCGEADMAEMGIALGADVPVCLFARAAFVGGIGERIAPAPALPPAPLVLVNPRVPLSTAAVFAARSGPFSEPGRFSEAGGSAAALARVLAERRNDLAPAAAGLCREVSRAIGALVRAPGCRLARMSGSGATCFGIFEDAASARRAAADIAAAEPGWWVAETSLVDDAAALAPLP